MGMPPRIALQAGDVKEKFEVKLTPTGAISGRVVDANGEPVQSANVMVEGASFSGGNGGTDENGRFRVGGLTPGRYRVAAELESMMGQLPPEIRSDGSKDVHYGITWYPNALTKDGGGFIAVKAGNETSGVEIRLIETPNVRVSGKVTGVPVSSGSQSPSARVMMELRQDDGTMRGTNVARDGSFEIWGLNPGKYNLRAATWDRSLGSAPVEVQVGDSNIDNINLALVALPDIAGRIEFEDEQAQTAAAPDGAQGASQRQRPRQVVLRDAGGPRFSSSVMGMASADGAFTLQKVAPGRYLVSVPGGFYVQSMRVGTTEMPAGVLDLTSVAAGANLALVVRRSTGEISGTVSEGAEGQNVALVGEETRFVGIQPGGAYRFDHIAPGKYKLAVIDMTDMRDAMMGNLDAYKDVVQDVEIGDGEKITKDLKRRREQ